jgi:hypothetical protein
MIWLLILITVLLIDSLFLWSLCRAAAKGDRT